MNHEQALSLVRQTGVVAIMRANSPDQLLGAADAIRAGGVRAIEVSLTTPGALGVIERAAARSDGDMLFGAGTVLDAESARATILAGAQFIVGPALDLALIELCRRYGVPVFPGAYTASEVVAAWQAGAGMVKIFPASVGGPELIKALKAPLPQVEMMAVGGVDLDNTADFVRAGASVVGVGSSLVAQRLLDTGDYTALTERARRFVAEVAHGRERAQGHEAEQ